MRHIINHLTSQKTLSSGEARQILSDIAEGIYSEIEMASFLTVYLMRSITVEELSGFRDALLEHCLRIDLQQETTIDLCGTGGDGKDTFNISTLASFVTAGAGAKVSKHGNYGVSSSCGSSNILEHFGYKFTSNQENLREQIGETGICFLHAPLFNPAMKNVAPVRKSLRVKTFFNMLGPMVNPAFPQKQLVGVFSLDLARLYGYIYQQSSKDFNILHSLDGYDEISLTGAFKSISNKSEDIFTPEDLGLKTIKPEEIAGGQTIEDSARIFQSILKGEGTEAQQTVVETNAAFALKTYYDNEFVECQAMAKESIESGKALASFNKMVEISQKI
ncbi:MAG: anthranilate phosphoribosyltransferase [Salinivirgaceae bacterium]|nr:anthranilate phosphoribosyltransferase [Salinivirgaceae bacterium]